MNWNILSKLKKTSKNRDDQIIDLLLKNRNLNSPQQIDQFLSPSDPIKLRPSDVGLIQKNLSLASKIINKAITSKQAIVIYGDYDADGICATAILWLALFSKGANVHPFIPHREHHGYGLSISGIDEIISKFKPSLLITVDNGIVAHDQADYVKKKHINLIITDHHQPDNTLPDASTIIHSDQISGSAVSWFLAKHFLSSAAETKNVNFSKAKPQITPESLLDLLSIGTIADLMPMVGINRSFAKFGLQALTRTTRPGLVSLKQKSNIQSGTNLTSYHVGYMLAPRINATGRLEHGLDSLRLLCTNNSVNANKLAAKLSEINKSRQDLTLELFQKADSIYQKTSPTKKDKLIIIDHPDFHEGVIGLIAGQLSEKYFRPAIVISRGGKTSKASARSIPGVNIIQLIRTQSSLLLGAGGHPAAAGFSLETKNINDFKKNLVKHSNSFVKDSLLEPGLSIDCQVDISDMTLELHKQIEQFEPFGIGNKRPVFTTSAKIIDLRAIGRDNTHLKMRLDSPNSPHTIDAIGFSLAEKFSQLKIGQSINLAFTLNKNEWNGNITPQLIIKDIKPEPD